jgi:hypothetical protein
MNHCNPPLKTIDNLLDRDIMVYRRIDLTVIACVRNRISGLTSRWMVRCVSWTIAIVIGMLRSPCIDV